MGFITFSILKGCKKDTITVQEQNAITVTKTGCKSEFHILSDSANQDCIEYSINNNILHVKHINAAFNCCPNKVYAIANISHDTIMITEKELLSQPCKCDCLYDVEYNIPNIVDSFYVIIVNEPFITDQSEKLIFSTYPILTSNGSFCKRRSTYPW